MHQASEDIAFFARFFLREYAKTAPPDFHRELYAALKTDERIVRAEPREHAKTTVVSIIYVLWCILFEKKRFILLISDSGSQASTFLAAVKNEMESNERILEYFGNLIDTKNWSSGEILTTTKVKVICRGTGASLRGLRHLDSRLDLIICDDLENDELVATEGQRRKLESWFNKALLNTIGPKGQVIVVGTILHYDSLLSNLLKKEGWNTRRLAAVKEDGTPLWPEVWSMQRLMERKRDIGSVAFQSEFMNEPIDNDTSLIKHEWMRYYDELPADLTYYGFCDPAISKEASADYTAICTIGYDKVTKRIYVVDMVRGHLVFSSQLDMANTLHAKYKYVRYGVEEVAYQAALKQELHRVYPKIPVVGVKVDKDKVRRLLRISHLVENGTVMFNRSLTDFIEELMRFPKSKHDDTVDAFTGAVSLVENVKRPMIYGMSS